MREIPMMNFIWASSLKQSYRVVHYSAVEYVTHVITPPLMKFLRLYSAVILPRLSYCSSTRNIFLPRYICSWHNTMFSSKNVPSWLVRILHSSPPLHPAHSPFLPPYLFQIRSYSTVLNVALLTRLFLLRTSCQHDITSKFCSTLLPNLCLLNTLFPLIPLSGIPFPSLSHHVQVYLL